jgi:hypothetical protein
MFEVSEKSEDIIKKSKVIPVPSTKHHAMQAY